MACLNENDTMFIERFLNAFKNIGGNEIGCIDYDNFKNIFLKKTGTEGKEILKLIDEEQHVQDGRLDFMSLCFSILSLKTIFNSFSTKNGKIPPASPRINTHTFTRNKGPNNIFTIHQKETNSEVPFTKYVKGLLFYIKDDLLGYRYQLELLESSVVEIFAKGIINEGHYSKIPIEILVFQDSKKKAFVTSSSIINDDGYCSIKFNLKKGKYILIPMLLKWDQNLNSIPHVQDVDSLMHVGEESNVSFTPICENALKNVYKAIDLDANGLLSQLEFDLFIRHTSGETASEEWTTVEDNFQMKNGQLTFEGFLELYRLVLQTDPPDMLNMFQRMGMDDKLEFKNSQPFILVVKSETAKFNVIPLPVSSYAEVTEIFLKKTAIEQGISSKVKNMNDLVLFKHHLPHRITFVIQNQAHSKVTVQLDCSGSVNCESHRKNLNYSVEILPRMSMIGHHLFPVKVDEDWSVECKESLK